MSSNVAFKPSKLKKQQRFIKLIEGMREGKPFNIIAEECHVNERTIDRDFWDWKDNGGFDKWLVTEFMILHDTETEKEKGDAYRVISDLLKKRLKEQVEFDAKVEQNVNTTITTIDATLRDYEWALEESARLTLQTNNPTEQMDTAPATRKTGALSPT